MGTFLSVAYTWSYEGEPQEGILLVGCDAKEQAATGSVEAKAITAVRTDSWHIRDKLMACSGEILRPGHAPGRRAL
jgi:hypothetical protein